MQLADESDHHAISPELSTLTTLIIMASFPEICEAMKDAMSNHGDKIRRKFNAVVVFDVDGESFALDASKTPVDDAQNEAALTVTTNLSVLQALLAKKLTPQQAFMKKQIKIKGKMALAMKLQIILDATRKELDRHHSRL